MRYQTYRSGPHTTLLNLLKGRGGSLGSLDELELGLRAVGALRLGHFGGDMFLITGQKVYEFCGCCWEEGKERKAKTTLEEKNVAELPDRCLGMSDQAV